MSWSDKEYDNWKLASPYENEGPEVFETEKFNLFSCSEDDVLKFDDEISKIEKLGRSHKNYNIHDYDSFKEFLLESIENLADELSLDNDAYDAQRTASENYQDEKEYALEQKYQQMKDDKLTGDK